MEIEVRICEQLTEEEWSILLPGAGLTIQP